MKTGVCEKAPLANRSSCLVSHKRLIGDEYVEPLICRCRRQVPREILVASRTKKRMLITREFVLTREFNLPSWYGAADPIGLNNESLSGTLRCDLSVNVLSQMIAISLFTLS